MPTKKSFCLCVNKQEGEEEVRGQAGVRSLTVDCIASQTSALGLWSSVLGPRPWVFGPQP